MNTMRRIAIEFLTIGVLGVAVAFCANGLRTKGHIKVSKNYFDTGEALVSAQRDTAARGPRPSESTSGSPASPAPRTAQEPAKAPESAGTNHAGTNGSPANGSVRNGVEPDERHPKHPYQEIDFDGVMAILKDPNTASGLNVIVDARKDDSYEEGHIPGAILCNPHEIDLYIDTLRPAVEGAEKVVVYCGGGDCEDSVAMCRELLEMNVPYEAVQLYAGGWKDWSVRRGPFDTGKD